MKSRFCLSSPFIIFRPFGVEGFFLPSSPLRTHWLELQPLFLFFATVILNLSFKCCWFFFSAFDLSGLMGLFISLFSVDFLFHCCLIFKISQ